MSEVLMGRMIVGRMQRAEDTLWQAALRNCCNMLHVASTTMAMLCSAGDILYCGADTGSYIDIQDLSQ